MAQPNRNDLPPEMQLALYRDMLRIRMIEEEIARRYYMEQEMRCPVHLSIGQEATAVGACAALAPEDKIVSTHRSHAHYLAKGGDLKGMLAEIYGKSAGCTGGRGGSMHLMDVGAGVVVSLPIVSSSIPVGVGIAFAARRAASDIVCGIFIGDAAVEEGAFHESANFAALHKLPVLFILENNLFSVYTPLSERQPDRPLTDVARAHGMASVHADGNDVLEVHRATQAAVESARAGKGPTLLVFDTYRWREHCGPNYDNDLGYRAPEEFETWKARCPITSFAAQLREWGMLDASTERNIVAGLESEIAEAFAFAKEAPLPLRASAADFVYA